MATKHVVTGEHALKIGNRLAEIQRQVFLQKEYAHDPEDLIRHLQCATEGEFVGNEAKSTVGIAEPQIIIPNLRSIAPTLADWLKAREELHKFFTGETIILRDIFAFEEADLDRTDIMPAFRPAGATNRDVVDWKKKLGVVVYEEADVMKYSGSTGSKESELLLVNRSLCPDDDTLDDNAKTPDQLIQVPNRLWLHLFDWCDADNIHFVVTDEHLDLQTWTWFPHDRLPGGAVACGGWGPVNRGVYLYWGCRGYRGGLYGARSTKKVPLKT